MKSISNVSPGAVIREFISEVILPEYRKLVECEKVIQSELINAVYAIVVDAEKLTTHKVELQHSGRLSTTMTIQASLPVAIDFTAVPEDQIFGSGFPIFSGSLKMENGMDLRYQVWYRPGQDTKLTIFYEHV